MGEIRVGISGWRYPPWRGVFYPPGLAQRRELEYAARHLSTVEINGTFYSLQRPDSFTSWAEATPPGFEFAVKGGRFITHMKRLQDSGTVLANFLAQGLLQLGDKLGPVLWQLPPTLPFEPALLEQFLTALPRTHGDAAALAARHDHRLDGRAVTTTATPDRRLRHALEVRHPSFLDPAVPDLLRRHDVALVVADTAGKFPVVREVTSDLVYVRLHGDTELYVSGYDDAALDRWAADVRRWSASADVYVYFDNDAKVRAPVDAMALADRLGVSPDIGFAE